MKYWRNLSFNMRLGIGMFAFLCAIYPVGFLVPFEDVYWFFGVLIIVIMWFLSAFVAIGALFLPTLKDVSLLLRLLDRTAPLLGVIAAWLSWNIASDYFSGNAHRAFAKTHEMELAGQPPKAVIYRDGIPDGGTAIVRSPGENPENFSSGLSSRLVNGNIRSCEKIDERDWICSFG